MTTHLIIPDCHSHFQHSNERADYLAGLLSDLRPDVVVNIGDAADMPSLSGYDKGKKSFQGRTYRADIDSHLDFQERMWGPVRLRKKRLPRSLFIEGNHEYRITRAIDAQPELEGAISFDDLDLDRWYTETVRYEGNTPGVIEIDGINYSHYFLSGIAGRPVGGEHIGHSLLTKQFTSCTVGHNHLIDLSVRSLPNGRKIIGLSAGCYQDYDADWAGEANKLWWRGVVIKHNVENGVYDPEFVSLERLKRIYGGRNGAGS